MYLYNDEISISIYYYYLLWCYYDDTLFSVPQININNVNNKETSQRLSYANIQFNTFRFFLKSLLFFFFNPHSQSFVLLPRSRLRLVFSSFFFFNSLYCSHDLLLIYNLYCVFLFWSFHYHGFETYLEGAQGFAEGSSNVMQCRLSSWSISPSFFFFQFLLNFNVKHNYI